MAADRTLGHVVQFLLISEVAHLIEAHVLEQSVLDEERGTGFGGLRPEIGIYHGSARTTVSDAVDRSRHRHLGAKLRSLLNR